MWQGRQSSLKQLDIWHIYFSWNWARPYLVTFKFNVRGTFHLPLEQRAYVFWLHCIFNVLINYCVLNVVIKLFVFHRKCFCIVVAENLKTSLHPELPPCSCSRVTLSLPTLGYNTMNSSYNLAWLLISYHMTTK